MRRQIWLDCDGVLADFDAHFFNLFGTQPAAFEKLWGSAKFWAKIPEEDPQFYRNLPLMRGARELYKGVAAARPIILTGCPRGGWAERQKVAWGQEHFPGVPVVTCMARDKALYCKPGDILIDDRDHYRDKWQAAGGIFIHYTDPDAAVNLKEMVS